MNEKSTPPTQEDHSDKLVSLLGVYSSQFSSYTTLLWQVPALALTGQSFLLTIALMSGSSHGARLAASGLAIGIAVSSSVLMHYHRGQSINYGELASRITEMLGMTELLSNIELEDAVPRKTNAVEIWKTELRYAYILFRVAAVYLFLVVDVLIFVSVLIGNTWFK